MYQYWICIVTSDWRLFKKISLLHYLIKWNVHLNLFCVFYKIEVLFFTNNNNIKLVISLSLHSSQWLYKILKKHLHCVTSLQVHKTLFRALHIKFFTFWETALDLCSLKILLRVLSFRFPWQCSWYYYCKVHRLAKL